VQNAVWRGLISRSRESHEPKHTSGEAPTAQHCTEHECCIRFFVPSGEVEKTGWWHAAWERGEWQTVGPDPAEAGFPDRPRRRHTLRPRPTEHELAALIPVIGHRAVLAAIDAGLFPPY
jgi:hypothetical protein